MWIKELPKEPGWYWIWDKEEWELAGIFWFDGKTFEVADLSMWPSEFIDTYAVSHFYKIKEPDKEPIKCCCK